MFPLVQVILHTAAGNERSPARIDPLVVGADKSTDMAVSMLAKQCPAMSADVVKRVDFSIVVTDDDQRVVADLKGKIIARVGDLTRMPDEQPASLPYAFDISAIDQRIVVEFTRHAEARLPRSDQGIDDLIFVGCHHDEAF